MSATEDTILRILSFWVGVYGCYLSALLIWISVTTK